MEGLSENILTNPKAIDLKSLLVQKSNTLNFDMKAHKISIAPMMDITNRYFRFLMRMLTKECTLYTEMYHENTILFHRFGHKEYLKFYGNEYPVVCQLGGNNPEKLAKCAKLCEEMGYNEVNLNIGCPSPRVQEGSFGACLMKEPELVGKIVKLMRESVKIPITVKCRLGVDDYDSFDFARNFVYTVNKIGGASHFIVHARKAFLKGLNPTQNRNIPPLKYDTVIQLKKEFPDLNFTINGGFSTINSIQEILKKENNLSGCMIGRASHDNPWMFSDFDRLFYNKKNSGFTRRQILYAWAEFGDYIMNQENEKIAVPTLVKPIVNLFSGEKHSNKYRQFLSQPSNFKDADKSFYDFILNGIKFYDKLNSEALDEKPKEN